LLANLRHFLRIRSRSFSLSLAISGSSPAAGGPPVSEWLDVATLFGLVELHHHRVGFFFQIVRHQIRVAACSPAARGEFVLIFFREVLSFAQPHFGIVMLLAILLVLFVGFVTRLTRRLLFAR
jgi:hypothetical protein